jgi:hypothetical protein
MNKVFFLLNVFFVVVNLLIGSIATADELKSCKVESALITEIDVQINNKIYLRTDKPNNCGCIDDKLFIFDNAILKVGKLWFATALTAKATGQPITAEGFEGSCSRAAAKLFELDFIEAK